MNPLLIAALLSGGGALANWKIQNDAIKAQNFENQRAMDIESAAREAERARQMSMEQLQAQKVAQALLAADPGQKASTVTAEVEDPGNEIVLAPADYNVPNLPGQGAEGPVGTEIGKIVSDALQRTKGILKAQATLSGQGTATQATQDALTRMGSELSTVGSNRRGSLAVAQRETSIPAARVTPSDSPLGDLLMLGGMLYGGMGGFGGFGAGKPLVAPGMKAATTPAVAAKSIFGMPLTPSGLPPIY